MSLKADERVSAISVLPECWSHRGASLRFPENTLASFEAACKDGAVCVESDLHVSADNVVLMLHDSSLDRVTNSTGKISERLWYGEDGMQHVRTKKEPVQPIATFSETLDLLMKPEYRHVKLNLDVKADNDPQQLFQLLYKAISAHADHQALLAPRILLGLWHPKFIRFAKAWLPECSMAHIGNDIDFARKYFWEDCGTFSLAIETWTGADGQRFLSECKKNGKKTVAFTVNLPEQMMETVRWELDAIITDVPDVWNNLRSALQVDYEEISSQYGRSFLWTTMKYYTPVKLLRSYILRKILEWEGGDFDGVEAGDPIVLR